MVNIVVEVSDDQRARLKSVLGPSVDLDELMGYVLLAGAREALGYATGEALSHRLRTCVCIASID